MRTAPTGPFQGIGEIAKAAEAATTAKTSGEFSPSTDKIVAIIWTSFLNSLGKSGLTERSMRRPERMASSVGLPSLLTHLEPLILPPAYNLSTYSTVKGK